MITAVADVYRPLYELNSPFFDFKKTGGTKRMVCLVRPMKLLRVWSRPISGKTGALFMNTSN